MLHARDIPTSDILEFLATRQGRWTSYWDVPQFMGIPRKLIKAKVKRLIGSGLSGGCDCGCRADLEITDKGLALIGQERKEVYGGY